MNRNNNNNNNIYYNDNNHDNNNDNYHNNKEMVTKTYIAEALKMPVSRFCYVWTG